jgi:hypothetical protein
MLSAVILTYRRPENIKKILDFYQSVNLVNEVIVLNNDWTCPVRAEGKVRIFESNVNWGIYGRYALFPFIRNDFVLIQDDDVLLTTDTVIALSDATEKNGGISGLYGRRPKEDNTYALFRDHDNEEVEMVIGRVRLCGTAYLQEFYNSWKDPEFCEVFGKSRLNLPFPANIHDDIIFSYFVATLSGKLNRVFNLPRTELPDGDGLHRSDPEAWMWERTETLRACQEFFLLYSVSL